MVKPVLEQISPEEGSSFTLKKFERDNFCNQADWHFHPEYEIVYLSEGSGKRYIADHISTFENGDLIFLGPNIPHFGFSNSVKTPHVEVVVQMRADFLGNEFFCRPELKGVKGLFKRAERGITFHGKAKRKIGELLIELAEKPHFERLIGLLVILELLANTDDYQTLNVNGFAVSVNPQELNRMRLIYDHVAQHYASSIKLSTVAEITSMTVPAFCRFFKKATNKTFTQFLNEFRIRQSCRWLRETNLTVAAIGFDCGFNNLSHFNHQFKAITGLSPSAYRAQNQILIQMKSNGLSK